MPQPRPRGVVAARLSERPVPSRARRSTSAGALRRRRWTVRLLKWILPAGALALLSLIALWPEIEGAEDRARYAFRRGGATPEAIRVVSPRYQGEDEAGRPYNVTADLAVSRGPEQSAVDLYVPRADLFLNGGGWLLAESRTGRYDRAAGRLDLQGAVTLWQDDGTTVTTEEARVRVREGEAEGDRPVAAQGPFGTLTGQGFRLRGGGAVVATTGASRAVLEGGR